VRLSPGRLEDSIYERLSAAIATLSVDVQKKRRQRIKPLVQALFNASLFPTSSLQDLLENRFKNINVADMFHACLTLPTAAPPEQDDPIVEWESALAESGLLQLFEPSAIAQRLTQSITHLAIGYGRTSDVQKAGEERSSSLHRQRTAIAEFAGVPGCLIVGFAYNMNGEPSYVPLCHDRRPVSKTLVTTLQQPTALCNAFNKAFCSGPGFASIDIVVVESLSRFSRDTLHGLADLNMLSRMGVRLHSARDMLDYDVSGFLTSSSMFTTTILLASATYERALIDQRTAVGRSRALARTANTTTLPMSGVGHGRASHCSHPAFVQAFMFALVDAFQINSDAVWDELVDDMNTWMTQPSEERQLIAAMMGADVQITKRKVREWSKKYADWLITEQLDAAADREEIFRIINQSSPAMLVACQRRATHARPRQREAGA
jgi:hypothetical protein